MDFEILILGTDVNAYYLARCYHEAFGKKATLLGKAPLNPTALSGILNIRYDGHIWTEQGFIDALFDYKKAVQGKPVLLISSNETYAGFITSNSEKLKAAGFLFNYPQMSVCESLMYKQDFYKTYQNSILNLPETFYFDCQKDTEIPKVSSYPVILKPSNVIMYNHLSFEGKNKIYKIKSETELIKTVNTVKAAGYTDTLIIQDFIPGDDSRLFDAVAYVNSDGKTEFLSFAQIGLQEHSRSMVGNAAVLINGYNEFGGTKEITDRLRTFLEDINYRGFAEFDLKYDERDNKFKVLEINARQGRSSYYVSALGKNLVKVLVDDLINKKENEYELLDKKVLLSFVNKSIIKKYIKNPQFKKEALSLMKKGYVNPIKYRADSSFKYNLYLLKRDYNYKKAYKNGYWKE